MTDKHTPEQRIVAQFSDKCGCSATGTDDKSRLTFNRCPTHAAAPEMLKALEVIRDAWDEELAEIARAAIKAAKGDTS